VEQTYKEKLRAAFEREYAAEVADIIENICVWKNIQKLMGDSEICKILVRAALADIALYFPVRARNTFTIPFRRMARTVLRKIRVKYSAILDDVAKKLIEEIKKKSRGENVELIPQEEKRQYLKEFSQFFDVYTYHPATEILCTNIPQKIQELFESIPKKDDFIEKKFRSETSDISDLEKRYLFCGKPHVPAKMKISEKKAYLDREYIIIKIVDGVAEFEREVVRRVIPHTHMVYGSKSGFRERFGDRVGSRIIFNAEIFDERGCEIVYSDLLLGPLLSKFLRRLSAVARRNLYILQESAWYSLWWPFCDCDSDVSITFEDDPKRTILRCAKCGKEKIVRETDLAEHAVAVITPTTAVRKYYPRKGEPFYVPF